MSDITLNSIPTHYKYMDRHEYQFVRKINEDEIEVLFRGVQTLGTYECNCEKATDHIVSEYHFLPKPNGKIRYYFTTYAPQCILMCTGLGLKHKFKISEIKKEIYNQNDLHQMLQS